MNNLNYRNKFYLWLLLPVVVLGVYFSENTYAGCQWYTDGPYSTGCVTGASYDYIFEESWMDHAYNNGEGPCQNPPNSCSKNDALCAPYSNAHYSSTSYYCPRSSCSQTCSPNTPAGCVASCATCTYVDEVLSWTECINGVQVANDVHQTTIPGTICSSVPLSRSCVAEGNCTGYSKKTVDGTSTGIADWALTGTGGKPITGTNIPVTVTSSTTFDLDCRNAMGTQAARKSVQVNVATCSLIPGVCASVPNTCLSLSLSSPLCNSGTAANLVIPPTPSSGSAPVGTFTWDCLGSCNGTNASCSSLRKREENNCDADFSACSLSCGSGTQTKECRYANCYTATETRVCNSHPCPPGYREVAPW